MLRTSLIAAVSGCLFLASCGDPATEAETTAAPVPTTAITTPAALETTIAPPTTASPAALPKPAVEIPKAIPTELVITDLTDGTGPAAKNGDTVIVHYVGVRSKDGVEFDNSFDRGEPFPVTLGAGGVIQGWDEGLIGAMTGMRRQLDIPGSLAYGDQPRGDIIGANEALTFVIDVVGVVAAPDPTKAPTAAPKPSVGATEVTFTDLIKGTGATPATGSSVVLHIVAFRGDTAIEIDNTWKSAPGTLMLDEASMFPGMFAGVSGMSVGGRREIIIPAAQMFEGAGNEQLKLPPATDLILVIDLIGAY